MFFDSPGHISFIVSQPVLMSRCLSVNALCLCVLSFGGGPAVNHLYMCAICQVEIEALAKRRKTEIDTFIKVNKTRPLPCA